MFLREVLRQLFRGDGDQILLPRDAGRLLAEKPVAESQVTNIREGDGVEFLWDQAGDFVEFRWEANGRPARTICAATRAVSERGAR
jgi:hypothetical protein